MSEEYRRGVLYSQHFVKKEVINMRKEVETLVKMYRNDKIGFRTFSEELDKLSCTLKEKRVALQTALK